VLLERDGLLSRHAWCDLDAEPPVQGSGFAWMLSARRLPFHDVLLMMIATSDNFCHNLVLRQIGIERLDALLHGPLGFSAGTRLERKLFDYDARAAGRDNYVSAQDCITLFARVKGLRPDERAWVEPMLAANLDSGLLLRDIPRDTLTFHHKTVNICGVLHDCGYRDRAELFLLTQNVSDEVATTQVFGQLGRLLLP
jgi:beta-lactamase class A